MSCYHLHGDAAGETHLTPLELPERESYAGTVRGLTEIPVTTMGMGEFVGRKPDVGVHHAPRRQFLVVLQGELEILTTLGEKARLHPGDVLFADDLGSKGHVSRDVGDDPLMLMALAIQPEWELQASVESR
jgi:mannose-6-phosphate isomerase-like protein (cupin superfamily)